MPYIKDDFQRELDAWDPEQLKRIKPIKARLRRAELVESLAHHPADTQAATLALFDLYAAGEFPDSPYVCPCFGYSLVEDFGDELTTCLDPNPSAQALAVTSVGLGDDGGGLSYFVDRSGSVQILDMGGMPFYWQHTFPTIDDWCWALFQVQLVLEEKTTSEALVAAARARGYYDALQICTELA